MTRFGQFRQWWTASALAVACLRLGLQGSPAQTIQYVSVTKSISYLQTNATTAIIDPTPVGQDYGGPYGFETDVQGSNLSGLTPPSLKLAAGSTFNDPAQFQGHLAYNADDDEWEFGLINANDWGGTSQAQMDSLFANGTYTFVVQGTTIPLDLAGNAYPNIPLATLTGGTWSNGQYFINPSNALTIVTSTFTGYGSNVNGYISINVNGEGVALSVHSLSPQGNPLTCTLPANTLPGGQTNQVQIAFGAVVSTNAALADMFSYAAYEEDTGVQVVTFPPPAAPMVQNVRVYKNIMYVQTNATTAIVDPTPVSEGYGGPYGFQADVIGLNLGGITPPGLTLPAGSTFNDINEFTGQLAYNAQGYNPDGPEWAFGLINADDWAATSQAEIDSLFANGTYQFLVQGTTIPLNLTGNAYPNTPIATLTGGHWTGGQYLIDSGNALTITSSTFTNYGANLDGRILLYANGAIAATSYHSSAPLSNSVTYTVPANTLAGGQSYTTAIAFDAIVSTNAALAGSYNCAYYDKVTVFQVVALPHVGVIFAAAGTLQLNFSGILQESSDLKTWNDVSPQPPSPWSVPVGAGAMFFRVRSGN